VNEFLFPLAWRQNSQFRRKLNLFGSFILIPGKFKHLRISLVRSALGCPKA